MTTLASNRWTWRTAHDRELLRNPQELLTSRKMMGEIRRGSGAEDGAAVYRGGRGSRIFVWKESVWNMRLQIDCMDLKGS